jgi:hypothetical protein
MIASLFLYLGHSSAFLRIFILASFASAFSFSQFSAIYSIANLFSSFVLSGELESILTLDALPQSYLLRSSVFRLQLLIFLLILSVFVSPISGLFLLSAFIYSLLLAVVNLALAYIQLLYSSRSYSLAYCVRQFISLVAIFPILIPHSSSSNVRYIFCSASLELIMSFCFLYIFSLTLAPIAFPKILNSLFIFDFSFLRFPHFSNISLLTMLGSRRIFVLLRTTPPKFVSVLLYTILSPLGYSLFNISNQFYAFFVMLLSPLKLYVYKKSVHFSSDVLRLLILCSSVASFLSFLSIIASLQFNHAFVWSASFDYSLTTFQLLEVVLSDPSSVIFVIFAFLSVTLFALLNCFEPFFLKFTPIPRLYFCFCASIFSSYVLGSIVVFLFNFTSIAPIAPLLFFAVALILFSPAFFLLLKVSSRVQSYVK